MNIRQAVMSDLDELMCFYDLMCMELGKQSFQPNGNKGGYPPYDEVVKAIEKSFQFIGIEDEKIVGTFILSDELDEAYKKANWKVNAGEHEAITLHALRVHPEYSRRGYAKQLMNHSLEVSKQMGYKVMRLDVMKGNDKAVQIYEKYGFEAVGEADITYPDIGYPMTCILLEVVL